MGGKSPEAQLQEPEDAPNLRRGGLIASIIF